MTRKAILDLRGDQTVMVVLEDGEPVEIAVERKADERIVGNIYMARVVNILPGMHAAFVDIGLYKNAFLSLDDLPAAAKSAGIQQVARQVKPGQSILVQVIKEPGGEKGPRVTMNPSFPGKLLVLLPTLEAAGVSRHIVEKSRRAFLLDIAKKICPPGMGLVIRTSAEDASASALEAELRALHSQWSELESKAMHQRGPALIEAAGSLEVRASRDLNAEIIRERVSPSIQKSIDRALQRKLWLNSGAFIVFDICEAMHVIDVNSGKFTGKKHLRDTLLKLNCEAAREIARQIRLRDLDGIIVIDFVDMELDEDRQLVLDIFLEASKDDRAKRHVHGFSQAGLLELTRRPVYQPIHKAFLAPCGGCHGFGYVLNDEQDNA